MGKFNRQQRRKIEKECWRANVKVDDIQAQAARDMQVDITQKVSRVMTHAMALVLMQDFKALQKRETRIDVMIDKVHEYVYRLNHDGTISKQEAEILEAANQALKRWYEQGIIGKGDKQNAKQKVE